MGVALPQPATPPYTWLILCIAHAMAINLLSGDFVRTKLFKWEMMRIARLSTTTNLLKKSKVRLHLDNINKIILKSSQKLWPADLNFFLFCRNTVFNVSMMCIVYSGDTGDQEERRVPLRSGTMPGCPSGESKESARHLYETRDSSETRIREDVR